jgi:tetratricopeptide (TPR) repeat protein
MQENETLVEGDTRLSQSILWQLQREYFEKEGVNAWNGQVPFFVTSNTFVANCYANLVASFFQDWIRKHPEASEKPFYILELGTGTGQLSFYVVKRLKEILSQLQLTKLKFVYVMSDFTHSNIKFFQSHPQLQPFIEEQILDFAIYNMEEEKDIELIHQKTILSTETIHNPLVVFGNYIFDTIAHDCFSADDNVLSEVKVNVTTHQDNMHNRRVISMDKLNIHFNETIIDGEYYEEPVLNEILQDYRQTLTRSKFLMPISSIRALSRLRKLGNDRLLLISSDKGYSEPAQLHHLNYPHFSFHGSFSMMVNFHAIGQYFIKSGGDCLFQTQRKGIKTSLFVSGMQFSDLPETQNAASRYVEGFSPADYFIIHRYISDTYPTANLDTLASHLVLTQYDPYMYNRLHERILHLLSESDTATLEHLLQSMRRIASNFYYMPGSHDILFEMAYLNQTLKRHEDAANYYQKSIKLFGKKFGSLYNLAICEYHSGNKKEALKYFKKAKKEGVHSNYAQPLKEWIKQLS